MVHILDILALLLLLSSTGVTESEHDCEAAGVAGRGGEKAGFGGSCRRKGSDLSTGNGVDDAKIAAISVEEPPVEGSYESIVVVGTGEEGVQCSLWLKGA